MKLINYGAASWVVLSILFLIAQGIVMLDKAMHIPFGWAPILAGVVMISIGLYDWSRKWILKHESSQNVSVTVQTNQESVQDDGSRVQ